MQGSNLTFSRQNMMRRAVQTHSSDLANFCWETGAAIVALAAPKTGSVFGRVCKQVNELIHLHPRPRLLTRSRRLKDLFQESTKLFDIDQYPLAYFPTILESIAIIISSVSIKLTLCLSTRVLGRFDFPRHGTMATEISRSDRQTYGRPRQKTRKPRRGTANV